MLGARPNANGQCGIFIVAAGMVALSPTGRGEMQEGRQVWGRQAGGGVSWAPEMQGSWELAVVGGACEQRLGRVSET